MFLKEWKPICCTVETMKIFEFFFKYKGMGKIVGAGAGAGAGAKIFEKLEPEPHKNRPAPQHCIYYFGSDPNPDRELFEIRIWIRNSLKKSRIRNRNCSK
jgi:hypothetical protein